MNCDEVGALHDIGDLTFCYTHLRSLLFVEEWIIGDDMHAEALCALRDLAADLAEANDAEGFN